MKNVIENNSERRPVRNATIDFLKGLAIIAVVFNHFGGDVLPFGYLGVDIFFVTGGYLLIQSLYKQFENSEFSYWKYIFRKIVRLWPLVIIVSTFSVCIGYFLMLPDDYENLVESAIASSAFANNILQCITTKNYWDIVNLYKPLMHFWYVGTLMHVYIVLPLLFWLSVKLTKRDGGVKRGFKIAVILGTVISLILYLIPSFSTAWKFYYFPFRLYELTIGGFIVLWKPTISQKSKSVIGVFSLVILLVLLCTRAEIIAKSFMLILTTVCTLTIIYCTEDHQFSEPINIVIKFGASIGKRSYSIYVWHQLIIAFMFYSFYTKHDIISAFVLACIVSIISVFSYKYIECTLGKAIGDKKKESKAIVLTGLSTIVLCFSCFIVYRHAGVVRDVPELNVYKNNVHKGMHTEYCDRPYEWNKDFEDNDAVKVLVLGNSFGRDFANILYEWDTNNRLQISYVQYNDDVIDDYKTRIEKSDFVFYADGPRYNAVPNKLLSIAKEKFYVVGNKNFGESNGIIYSHRFSKDYYNQSVKINDKLIESNKLKKNKYGDHYIDLMNIVMIDNTHAKVFTDDNKYISQDCRHLTQSGAQYYAKKLNLGDLFGMA